MSRFALKTFGAMIKAARAKRGLSQSNLASRLNVSRQSVMAIERGAPTVAIGIAFEAAAIVGIPLLADDEQELQKLERTIASFSAVLPKRVRQKDEPIDDNF